LVHNLQALASLNRALELDPSLASNDQVRALQARLKIINRPLER